MRGLQETEQFYTISGGTLERDGDPRQTGEMIAYIRLNHRDHIENRIAWALIHAAKLCGAKAY
jgi:hypothetical protein